MKDDMLAYCGLDCSKCGAYIAKQNDNYELRKQTAEMWSSPGYQVKPEEVFCDGCKTQGGTYFKHCANCAVRECASARGVRTCAHCDDYGCEKIKGALDILGEYARSTLKSIREAMR